MHLLRSPNNPAAALSGKQTGSIAIAIWSLAIAIAPATLAHNVEVAEDVAATMHIEPNHNPRAGEPALTWFALTRQGGELIAIDECDCQLAVYKSPYQPGDRPVLQPALTAINAEQYQGIPGSNIRFPASGQYTLALSGTPKATGKFKPFTLRYPVIVLAGTPAASPAPPRSAASQPAPSTPAAPPWKTLGIAMLGLVGLGILGALFMKPKK